MTFSEKIDKVLKANKLKLHTIEALEQHCGIGAKTLRKNYSENTEPTERILVKLLEGIGINREWWDDQVGDMFIEKGTPAIKSTGNTSSVTAKETFYQDLIEGNEQYNLIPRAVLTDYKIVPDKVIDVIIKSTEDARAALEKSRDLEIESLTIKHETIIEGLNNKIRRLQQEIDELRGQIPG